MSERLPLLALNSATTLVERLLPEREPNRETYASLSALMEILRAGDNWISSYVKWELGLLNQLGYGLDLTKCAATGSTEELIFISPRTGCAVSAGAGAPYREKLFALPLFFRSDVATASAEDIQTGLNITGHFLARCAEDADAGNIPEARGRFMDGITREAKK